MPDRQRGSEAATDRHRVGAAEKASESKHPPRGRVRQNDAMRHKKLRNSVAEEQEKQSGTIGPAPRWEMRRETTLAEFE
jgi:hypothetical protein